MKPNEINSISFSGLLSNRAIAKRHRNSRLLHRLIKSDYLYVKHPQKNVFIGVSVYGKESQITRITPKNVTYEKVSPKTHIFHFIQTHKALREKLFRKLSKPYGDSTSKFHL